MGIHGLTKLLGDNAPKCIKEQAFNNYFGRKIAVDASMHIYQFLAVVGRQGDQLLSNEAGEVTSHLQGMFYRTARMLEAGEQKHAGTCTCSTCQNVCKITAPACSFALHASAPSIALQAAVAAAQWHNQDKQQAACHTLAHTSACTLCGGADYEIICFFFHIQARCRQHTTSCACAMHPPLCSTLHRQHRTRVAPNKPSPTHPTVLHHVASLTCCRHQAGVRV
jgi:hypothetical protein